VGKKALIRLETFHKDTPRAVEEEEHHRYIYI
jgi:hypothetical protein